MGNARFKRKMLEPRSEPLVAPFDGANRFAFQAQGKPRVRIQCAEHIQVFHHNFPAQPGLPVRQLLRGDMQSAYRHLAVQFQIRHFHDAASGDARRPIPAENVLRLAQKGPTLVAAICSAIAALRAHRAVDLRKIPIAYILQAHGEPYHNPVDARSEMAAHFAPEGIVRARLMPQIGAVQKDIRVAIQRGKYQFHGVVARGFCPGEFFDEPPASPLDPLVFIAVHGDDRIGDAPVRHQRHGNIAGQAAIHPALLLRQHCAHGFPLHGKRLFPQPPAFLQKNLFHTPSPNFLTCQA